MTNAHPINAWMERVRQMSRPLVPLVTGIEPVLQPVRDVRVVLFDVYGTLLISASGDIGAAEEGSQTVAVREALVAAGFSPLRPTADTAGARLYGETIAAHHQQSRAGGIAHPEVDSVIVWKHVLQSLSDHGLVAGAPTDSAAQTMAIEYELRTNPVWPMPQATALLAWLRERSIPLGIISNAQFYTAPVIETLFGETLTGLGFSSQLLIWSYREGRAKPSGFLFEEAARRLRIHHNLTPNQVLYAGNDMRKDIVPAQMVGFRTALFAGDRRSYRPLEGAAHPDLLITNWDQLPGVLHV